MTYKNESTDPAPAANPSSHHPDLSCGTCKASFAALIPSLPPSPVPGSLTQSGSTFSVSQVSSIRDAVSTATEGIQTLDDRISQLEFFLSVCKQAKNRHTEFIRHHTSLLSFARRLPAEIWSLVFEWAQMATPSTVSGIIFESADQRSMPMLATHVCRYWRRIAISTPKLWSKLHIRVLGSFPESKVHLINAWLTRSGACPLTIRVDSGPEPWTIVPQDAKNRLPQAINILISHSARWKEVSLRLWSEVYRSVAFPIDSAPLLESISITTRDFYLAPSWYPVFFSSAPRLGVVRLENFLPAMASYQRMIPWGSVSDMCLGSGRDGLHYTTSEALNILRIIPNLTLFGAGCMPDFDNASDGPQVRHGALESLSLRTGNSRIFELLTAPSLTQLELSSFHTVDEQNIRLFISRSPKLRRLVLDDSNFAFIAGLTHRDCPIEEFEVRLYTSDLSEAELNAFSALAPCSPSLPVLPHLKSISIYLSFKRDNGGDAPVKSLQLLNAMVALTRRRCGGGDLLYSDSIRSHRGNLGLGTIGVWVDRKNATDVTMEAFSNLKELGLEGLGLHIS